MNATAGDAYRIGNARLGGFNGIPAFPILNVPGDTEHGRSTAPPTTTSSIVCLLASYLICRWILSSAFGRVLIGIRENEARMELLGYNVAGLQDRDLHRQRRDGRPRRLPVRQLGRDRHAERVQPRHTAEVMIWVIVGGLGTLIGPIVGAVVLGYLKLVLGQQTLIDNSLVLGAILVLVVLLMPRGFVPSFGRWRGASRSRQVHRRQARGTRRRRIALQDAKQ